MNIDKEAWEEWKKMRKSIKKPLTEYAEKLAIKTLEKLHQEGNDPTEVLQQSILNCWQGLFPVKGRVGQKQYPVQDSRNWTEQTLLGVAKQCQVETRPGESLDAFRSRVAEKMASIGRH
jgi:hypothetical protein